MLPVFYPIAQSWHPRTIGDIYIYGRNPIVSCTFPQRCRSARKLICTKFFKLNISLLYTLFLREMFFTLFCTIYSLLIHSINYIKYSITDWRREELVDFSIVMSNAIETFHQPLSPLCVTFQNTKLYIETTHTSHKHRIVTGNHSGSTFLTTLDQSDENYRMWWISFLEGSRHYM